MVNGNGGTMERTEGFGHTTELAIHETASTAIAEQAKAEVQARFVMALRRPRDMDEVRLKLLKECKRPSFAKVALYSKPIGKGKYLTGLSIRFAEAAIRCLGNLMPQTMLTYDDATKMIGRVALTDLEGNVTFQKDILVKKTVERKFLKSNQKPIETRTNSYGDTVYIVAATDEEVMVKFAALESKALRNHTLRVLPGDIQDECKDQIGTTARDQHAADPDGVRKKITDDFASLGVKPVDLVGYLGHDLDKITHADGQHLFAIFTSIKSGEATWSDFADKDGEGEGDDDSPVNKVMETLEKKKSAPPPKVVDQVMKEEPKTTEELPVAHRWNAAIDAAKAKHGIEIVASVFHALELPKDRRSRWDDAQMNLGAIACEMLAGSERAPSEDEIEMFATLARNRV